MGLIRAERALEIGEKRVGGKAIGLAKLEAARAPVPPWAAVPAEYFAKHLEKNSLDELIQSTLEPLACLDMDDPKSLKAIQEKAEIIQDAIRAGVVDSELEKEVGELLGSIGPGPFAVRSSMVGEDSAEHSFAGQLDSFLFQRDVTEVCHAIKGCWASGFGDRALAYHLRANLSILNIRVGVVVQRMIDGDVSGVLFTANPVNGRRDEALLTAAWGQGEGIVSGLCNTDEFVWRHTGEEVSASVADKDIKVTRAPGGERGTIEIHVDEPLREIRCLSTEQVDKICKEALRVADDFGLPQDIEWTIEQDELFFVQSRPITSLPEPPNLDGPVVVWDNSNIQESYCGVTTPLTFSFASRAYASAYRQTQVAMGLSQELVDEYASTFQNLLGLIRGRVYYNINNWYRGLLLLPSFGRNKSDMEKMMGLEDPVDMVTSEELTGLQKLASLPGIIKVVFRLWLAFRKLPQTVPAFLNNYATVAKRLDRSKFMDMSFSELMAVLDVLTEDILERWHTPIVNDFYVMMTNGTLNRFLTNAGFDPPTAIQNNLIAGEEGIESTEPTRFLMRLAKQVRADPALQELIDTKSATEALEVIHRDHKDLSSKLHEYIEKYGDRVMGELKLETITLREDPLFVIDVIRNYASRPDIDPDVLEANEKKLRNEAEAQVHKKIGFLRRGKFQRAVTGARNAVKNRENMRLTRTRLFGLYRDVYRALGERLKEAGKLEDGRDVFYLTVDEIDAYFEGRSLTTNLAGLAALRKADFESYHDQEPPHHFQTRGPIYFGNQYRYEGKTEIDPDANVLVGTGCYPGVVESPIRLIFSPKDELSINGKILCTVRTDPGWAPLFPTCSGVLVERGSTLSHSAVVARELGIPAVVGVPGLTTIVTDGERVRLDGEKGTVERLDHSNETEQEAEDSESST